MSSTTQSAWSGLLPHAAGLLHALRLDPKIAAGPLTLTLADLMTLLLYLSIATWLLGDA